jgi:vacuolar protein sorting-associated protein 35
MAAPPASSSAVGTDQERLLDEALAVVKEQAFYMKRAIDNDNLREALKHSSNMICELRTSLLSPKQYYDLYSHVFDELQHIASFFEDTGRHGRKMVDLYESVQHAGNILPRLYLLILVGAAYIKSKSISAKEILTDMAELCKGVQHPMRGLFLRYFLSQMCKDKLPEPGSEYEDANVPGSIDDVLYFILTNFIDSNMLWVRIQTQGPARDKARRERERHDLRVLVGANLVRVAQLESLTADIYVESVLPRILEQVTSSKDAMAQQYLLDCVIQVFPDEYHLLTLERFLGTCMQVTAGVDLKPVLSNLMSRLESYIQNNPVAVPAHLDVFELFRSHLAQLFDQSAVQAGEKGEKKAMDTAKLLELLNTFLTFTLAMYPDRIDYVEAILKGAVNVLTNMAEPVQSRQVLSGDGVDAVVEMLAAPLRSYSLAVLDLSSYPELMKFLSFSTRKSVATNMVNAVLDAGLPLEDPSSLKRFLQFISPICLDDKNNPVNTASEEFATEQMEVCRLVFAIKHEDLDVMMQMYTDARAFFGQGGPHRMVLTLPPVVHQVFKIVPLILDREFNPDPSRPAQITTKKALQFVHKTITVIATCVGDAQASPELIFNLWLYGAKVANDCERVAQSGGYEPIAVEFLSQALICFEEEMSDSRVQFNSLCTFMTCVSNMSHLEEENYVNMSQKSVQYAAQRLLKKQDQCRAIAHATSLFWSPVHKDGKRVLECLQKCVRVADACIQTQPQHISLFTEVLDTYIMMYEKDNEEITSAFIGNLLGLVSEHLNYAEPGMKEVRAAKVHFANVIAHIKRQAKSEERVWYKDLDVSKYK